MSAKDFTKKLLAGEEEQAPAPEAEEPAPAPVKKPRKAAKKAKADKEAEEEAPAETIVDFKFEINASMPEDSLPADPDGQMSLF